MVSIEHIGNIDSEEYKAASELILIFKKEFKDAKGHILFLSPAICFGQNVKDIDIVVIGQLEKGFSRQLTVRTKVRNNDDWIEEEKYSKNIYINNFVFCIELKDLHNKNVRFRSSVAYVRYKENWHNATEQSEQQKYSLKNFLEETIGWSPYICNFIWFRNILKDDLPKVPHNWIPSEPSLNWILHLACNQKLPILKKTENTKYYSFSSNKLLEDNNFNDFKKAFEHFTEYKENIGFVTRKKLERITKTLLKDQIYSEEIGNKLVIFRGRAGTGKTIKLLHLAHDLCKNHEKRCLILTYNKALVSDIRRTIALSGIHTGIDTSTISIRTVHSYIRELLLHFQIIEESKSHNHFLENYETLKNELLSYLQEGVINSKEVDELIKSIFFWDTILIDEGQDWPENEKNIIFFLFKSNNIIVADGIDQLIRSQSKIIWDHNIQSYKPPVEKRSKRQKANICRFIQSFCSRVNIEWDVDPEKELPGGKILIIEGKYSKSIHDELYNDLIISENKPYEMLFLCPPSLVKYEMINNKSKSSGFIFSDDFQKIGIKLWDGTLDKNKSEYPTNIDEYRLFQFDSSRGLEGWTVVCLNIDDFQKYKFDTFKEDNLNKEQLDLGLQSFEEKALEFSYRWLTIPFSRAIDTLVLTINSKENEFSKLLYELYQSNQDYIEWIVANAATTHNTA